MPCRSSGPLSTRPQRRPDRAQGSSANRTRDRSTDALSPGTTLVPSRSARVRRTASRSGSPPRAPMMTIGEEGPGSESAEASYPARRRPLRTPARAAEDHGGVLPGRDLVAQGRAIGVLQLIARLDLTPTEALQGDPGQDHHDDQQDHGDEDGTHVCVVPGAPPGMHGTCFEGPACGYRTG